MEGRRDGGRNSSKENDSGGKHTCLIMHIHCPLICLVTGGHGGGGMGSTESIANPSYQFLNRANPGQSDWTQSWHSQSSHR